MSYVRRLPSGKWQATMLGPDGRKHTRTDRLKSVVTTWAAQQEATPRGERRDPRRGDVRVAEWRARYAAAHAGKASAPRNASLWAVHCAPKWACWRMSAVTRMEAQAWVGELAETASQRDGGPLSAATVHATVRVMSSMFRAAVRDQVVSSNPFSSLSLTPVEPQPVFFYEPGEAAALYAAAGALGDQWRVMTELGMQSGLRFEELAGLHGHRVDWLRGRLEVVDVMTRRGLRQWPKSRKSHRTAPLPPQLLEDDVEPDDRPGPRPAWCSPRPLAAQCITPTSVPGCGIRRSRPRASGCSRLGCMRHTAASLAGAGRRPAV